MPDGIGFKTCSDGAAGTALVVAVASAAGAAGCGFNPSRIALIKSSDCTVGSDFLGAGALNVRTGFRAAFALCAATKSLELFLLLFLVDAADKPARGWNNLRDGVAGSPAFGSLAFGSLAGGSSGAAS